MYCLTQVERERDIRRCEHPVLVGHIHTPPFLSGGVVSIPKEETAQGSWLNLGEMLTDSDICGRSKWSESPQVWDAAKSHFEW